MLQRRVIDISISIFVRMIIVRIAIVFFILSDIVMNLLHQLYSLLGFLGKPIVDLQLIVVLSDAMLIINLVYYDRRVLDSSFNCIQYLNYFVLPDVYSIIVMMYMPIDIILVQLLTWDFDLPKFRGILLLSEGYGTLFMLFSPAHFLFI